MPMDAPLGPTVQLAPLPLKFILMPGASLIDLRKRMAIQFPPLSPAVGRKYGVMLSERKTPAGAGAVSHLPRGFGLRVARSSLNRSRCPILRKAANSAASCFAAGVRRFVSGLVIARASRPALPESVRRRFFPPCLAVC